MKLSRYFVIFIACSFLLVTNFTSCSSSKKTLKAEDIKDEAIKEDIKEDIKYFLVCQTYRIDYDEKGNIEYERFVTRDPCIYYCKDLKASNQFALNDDLIIDPFIKN